MNFNTFTNVMHLLTPHAAVGLNKIRIGKMNDGGYVMLDDLSSVKVAICGGLDADDSFEQQLLSAYGINVLAFDHTSSYMFQNQDRGYQWFKQPLCGFDSGNSTLDLALSGYADYSAILKIDIEGDEWKMFTNTATSTYKKIRQFVCEFHNFPMQVETLDTIKKITEHFRVVHVHGNNWGVANFYGSQTIPSVIEITFANIGCYDLHIQGDVYPTEHDQPNNPTRPDYILGTFTI